MPCRVTALVVFLLLLPAAPAAAERLPAKPAVSAWLRASGSDARVIAAGRTVRLPRGEAIRLEAIRRGARLRIAVGDRRLRVPASARIRLAGRLRATNVLGTGSSTTELIAHRLVALEPALTPGWAPDGSAPSGRIRRTRDWKRGFYAGALWRAADAVPAARRVLERLAWRATRDLWGGENEDTHDVGFIFTEASLGALRGPCFTEMSARCRAAQRSLERAARTLRRMAAATPAGVIPVVTEQGCRICQGDELKVYIDSALNMTPLLGGDEARRLAAHHLAFLARELLRPDGSTIQQLLLRASTGEITRKLGHDPLAPSSTWARGQAWAVRGFAEAAAVLGGDAIEWAERAADWVAARPRGGPGWDWSRPAGSGNPLDTSAAAITAAGLERLLDLRCRGAEPQAATPEQCAAWDRASGRLLGAAARHVSRTPGRLGRFYGQRYLWDPSRQVDYRGEYTMGTDYLLEALSSRGSRSSATTLSTASGRSGASASSARSR